jgi:hypothetical protein
MVGGVHVGVQREGTLPLAVVGSVALRCNDPVLFREESLGSSPDTSKTMHSACGQVPCPSAPPPPMATLFQRAEVQD